MLMPGRKYSAESSYRYGFNGKENDNEVKGVEGSQQDYGFRIYDPRLGKFLSVDPLTKSYPWYSPYQFAGNKPIWAMDLDGKEEYFSELKRIEKEGYTQLKLGNLNTVNDRSFIIKLPTGIIDLSTGDQYYIDVSVKYSMLNIKVNFVSYKGVWVRIPPNIKLTDLPDLDDDQWDTFETYDQYQNRLLGYVDLYNQTVDLIEHVKNFRKILKNGITKSNSEADITKKGWKVGDPISSKTAKGKSPAWSTIRARHWKNRAKSAKKDEFTEDQLKDMRRGRSPLQYDPGTGKMERVELHHPNGREGENIYKFEEKLPSEHAQLDTQRRIKKN